MPYQYLGGQRGGYSPQYPQQGLQGLQYQQPQQQQESPFSKIKPQNIKSAYDMWQSGQGITGATPEGMSWTGHGSGGAGIGGATAAGGAQAVAGTGAAGAGGATTAGMGMGATTAIAPTAGGAGGAAAGGGASGMGGAAASAGPWAALAAIIMVNEYNAKGHRSKNKKQYALDMATGAVANQDMQQRWLPKLGLKEGSSANKYASMGLNPVGYAFDKIF